MTFHSVGNGIIIPTDFHSIIFQRGRWLNHQPAMNFRQALLDQLRPIYEAGGSGLPWLGWWLGVVPILGNPHFYCDYITGWWFGFHILPYIGNNHPLLMQTRSKFAYCRLELLQQTIVATAKFHDVDQFWRPYIKYPTAMPCIPFRPSCSCGPTSSNKWNEITPITSWLYIMK